MPPWNGGPSGWIGLVGPINDFSAAKASRGSSGEIVSVLDGVRARYDQRPRSPTPSESRHTAYGSSAKAASTSAGSRHGARRIGGGLAMQADILLPHPGADGENAVAAQHPAARQQSPMLPV